MVVGRIQLLVFYWDRVLWFLADCWLKVALSVLHTCHSMVTPNMAVYFTRGTTETSQREGGRAFMYNPVSEGTFHHLCHIPFAVSKTLGPVHTRREW